MPLLAMRSLNLLVFLHATLVLFNISVHSKETFYVKPDPSPAHDHNYTSLSCSCPNACTTFDVYANITASGRIESISDATGREIELIFLCGNHTLSSQNTATLNLSRLKFLAVKGYGSEVSPVVIRNVILIIQNISILHLEDVTLVDVSFSVHPADLEDRVLFHIKNSIFIESDCLVVHSHLTIENSDIINGTNTAFNMVQSTLTLVGNVTFRGNSGERGGALGLTSSYLNFSRDANVTFSQNHATSIGGAIFVNNPTEIYKVLPHTDCFYHLLDFDENASYSLTFTGNFADKGGSHIFGSSLRSSCTAARNESDIAVPSYKVILSEKVFRFKNPELSDNPIHSAIAATPARICVCDENDVPQCVNETKIFISNVTHLPGEMFSLSVVLIGGDFGATIGIVQANLLSPHHAYPSCSEEYRSGYEERVEECYQLVFKMDCTKVNYTIYSKNPNEMLSLTALMSTPIRDTTELYKRRIKDSINMYINEGIIRGSLIFTPLFMNVTLKCCPPGFSLSDEILRCDCYLPLKTNYEHLKCLLSNSSGLLSHPKSWIGVSSVNETEVIMSSYCPVALCNQSQSELLVTLESTNSIDAQCALNHAGRLCGRCKDGFSLAIGSSKCVKCSNNKNLALLIFFAAAGFLLILFITFLNLTVTQGMINGVVFYANIVWVYESIFFPQETTGILLFLRIFIAWLNLDFGIETCFVAGLDAFWKTLLQYVFPIYIWSIVLIIIYGAKYSTRLTKLFGSRTVSILSTLALLSYMKLLRNAIVSLSYAHLYYYNSERLVRSIVVWAVDGTLKYCELPHFFLFAAALITLCLCLPYILLLLFGRWLRNIPYFTRFHPVFDSYFASIENRHHYWPGILLVARAFLYLIRFAPFEHEATLKFVLLITVVALLGYMSVARPQKSLAVFALHSAFLVNLVILSGAILYVDSTTTNYKDRQSKNIAYITIASTGAAAVKFCIIIASLLARLIPYNKFRTTYRSYKFKYQKSVLVKRRRKTVKMPTTVSYTTLRDSILESQLAN